MQRVVKAALGIGVMACVVWAGACGGSGDGASPDPVDDGAITGTYVLKTVNGAAPPGVYHETPSERLMLDTATIRLSANGAYSDIRQTTLFDATGAHVATSTKTGTWTSSGNDVTLAFNNDLGIPSTAVLTVTNGSFTKTESGVVLVFKK